MCGTPPYYPLNENDWTSGDACWDYFSFGIIVYEICVGYQFVHGDKFASKQEKYLRAFVKDSNYPEAARKIVEATTLKSFRIGAPDNAWIQE